MRGVLILNLVRDARSRVVASHSSLLAASIVSRSEAQSTDEALYTAPDRRLRAPRAADYSPRRRAHQVSLPDSRRLLPANVGLGWVLHRRALGQPGCGRREVSARLGDQFCVVGRCGWVRRRVHYAERTAAAVRQVRHEAISCTGCVDRRAGLCTTTTGFARCGRPCSAWLEYRKRTQFDAKWGLWFWDNAMQSGADNNAALTNDPKDRSAILAVDASVYAMREYLAMAADCRSARRSRRTPGVIASRPRPLARRSWPTCGCRKDAMFLNRRRDNGEWIRVDQRGRAFCRWSTACCRPETRNA